jgi:hypothetical protein
MNSLTIPKGFINNDDLIVIQRKTFKILLSQFNESKENDWIYQEPFLGEITSRIDTLKKKINLKLIEWKPQNSISCTCNNGRITGKYL